MDREVVLHVKEPNMKVLFIVGSRWIVTVHILNIGSFLSALYSVFKINCQCSQPMAYVGSAKLAMRRFYLQHKSDRNAISLGDFGLAKHFCNHHRYFAI